MEEDERADDLAHRAGPDGRSALDHVDRAARATALIGAALHEVLTRDDPALEGAVVDDAVRGWESTADASSASALDFLTVEVEALSAQIDATHAEQWVRSGTVAGDRRVTALELAQEAVRTGAEYLRAAEAAMQAARRNR